MKGLRATGAEPRVVRAPAELTAATGVVVPGVGHFDATRSLGAEWRAAVRDAMGRGVPLLGICLGMQWLYAGSDEAPDVDGLGIFDGRVRRLTGAVKLPHVGWNSLDAVSASSLLDGVDAGAEAYFTHSYAAPVGADTVASTEHGDVFASVVERGVVAGMQFHPEKSGQVGLRLLKNWVASHAL